MTRRRQKVSGKEGMRVSNPHMIRVPPEILGKIYLENVLPHYPYHRGSRYPPMAVSKSWRNAALSHPQLWTRINITEYSDLLQSSPHTLQIWLSRSKPRPLDVFMNIFQNESEAEFRQLKPKDFNLYEPIMKVLFAQASRWGSLHILVDEWQMSHIFQVLERARHLRELTLQLDVDRGMRERLDPVYEPWATSGLPTILLPSVTALSVSLHLISINAFPFLELPNLTDLSFEYVDIELEDLVRMMKGMPKLALLTFEVEAGVSCTRMPADTTDVFDGLESLMMWDCSADYSFLPHLAQQCPDLRDITLYYRYCRDLPSARLESLTEITLILMNENHENDGRFSYAEAHDALMFCPNARLLTLEWQREFAVTAISFDPFIKALAARGDTPEGVVPKLEHLTLKDVVLDMTCLLEMLQSRLHSGCKALRSGETFYLTLEGCYGLPNIERGSVTEVRQLFADPPDINMPFRSWRDPYGC